MAWDPRRRFNVVQLASNDTAHTGLAVDVDDVGTFRLAIQDDELPPPSIELTRKSSGNIHAIWLLKTPVHRHPKARYEPLKLWGDMGNMLTFLAGGDSGYNGLLQYHPIHSEIEAHIRGYRWELAELAEWSSPRWKAEKTRKRRQTKCLSYAGRNCFLFMETCRWAGRRQNFGADIYAWVKAQNQAFDCPLPESEERSIAKSVARYQSEWKQADPHELFLLRQRMAGVKSGATRRKKIAPRDRKIEIALAVHNQSVKEAAAEHKVSESTVKRVRAKAILGPAVAREARDRKIIRMRSEGLKTADIARMMNVHRSTVWRVLKRGPDTGPNDAS